jgi:hypothetical protein
VQNENAAELRERFKKMSEELGAGDFSEEEIRTGLELGAGDFSEEERDFLKKTGEDRTREEDT